MDTWSLAYSFPCGYDLCHGCIVHLHHGTGGQRQQRYHGNEYGYSEFEQWKVQDRNGGSKWVCYYLLCTCGKNLVQSSPCGEGGISKSTVQILFNQVPVEKGESPNQQKDQSKRGMVPLMCVPKMVKMDSLRWMSRCFLLLPWRPPGWWICSRKNLVSEMVYLT